jgi:hypothetical protein
MEGGFSLKRSVFIALAWLGKGFALFLLCTPLHTNSFGTSLGTFRDCFQGILSFLQPGTYEEPAPVYTPEQRFVAEAYFEVRDRYLSYWDTEREFLLAKLQHLRTLPRFARRNQAITEAQDSLDRTLHRLTQGKPIGMHSNENGGRPEDFLSLGGILATHGDRIFDIAASMSPVPVELRYGKPTVFFYDSRRVRIGVALSRLGAGVQGFKRPYCSVLFDLDAVEKMPAVEPHSAMRGRALAFPSEPHGIGIPKDRFFFPPISFETDISGRLAVPRLSYQEATYLSALWLDMALAAEN